MGEFLGLLVMNLAFDCLVGCAPVQGAMPELRLPPKRIVQSGYSVLPLHQAGWRVMRRTPTLLALARRGANADDTVTIQASTYDAAKAAAELPLAEQNGAGPEGRFRMMEASASADERAGCTRRHVVAEDRAPARRSGGHEPMILETLMLTCTHPEEAALGIALAYSQRYEAGRRDPAFDADAAALLKEFRFAAAVGAREKNDAR